MAGPVRTYAPCSDDQRAPLASVISCERSRVQSQGRFHPDATTFHLSAGNARLPAKSRVWGARARAAVWLTRGRTGRRRRLGCTEPWRATVCRPHRRAGRRSAQATDEAQGHAHHRDIVVKLLGAGKDPAQAGQETVVELTSEHTNLTGKTRTSRASSRARTDPTAIPGALSWTPGRSLAQAMVASTRPPRRCSSARRVKAPSASTLDVLSERFSEADEDPLVERQNSEPAVFLF